MKEITLKPKKSKFNSKKFLEAAKAVQEIFERDGYPKHCNTCTCYEQH